MNHSEGIAKLAAALVKVQADIEHAHKNATNPHFRNTYANLTEVIDTARPVLTKHGISVVQFPGYVDGVTTLETVLTHESGEWMSGTAGARVQKDDPQGVGSALTYLRRYSLAAVCGIGQEDDDGEAGSERPTTPTREQRMMYDKPKPSSEPNGVKHSNVPNGRAAFDWDAVAPGKKAAGRSWRKLMESEDGRGFISWAVGNMAVLNAEAKATLAEALLHPVGAAAGGVVALSEPEMDSLPF